MSYMRERVNDREETKRVSFYFPPSRVLLVY